MKTWRTERTGWRCQAISERHGAWGYNCPCVDLDFVVCEYNHGLPVALIEYKDKHAKPPDITHPTYKALKALADGYASGPLPFLIAVYCPDEWWFQVYPVNEAAKTFYAGRTLLSEKRFVKSLYLMRCKTLNKNDIEVIEQLNDIQPPGILETQRDIARIE